MVTFSDRLFFHSSTNLTLSIKEGKPRSLLTFVIVMALKKKNLDLFITEASLTIGLSATLLAKEYYI